MYSFEVIAFGFWTPCSMNSNLKSSLCDVILLSDSLKDPICFEVYLHTYMSWKGCTYVFKKIGTIWEKTNNFIG